MASVMIGDVQKVKVDSLTPYPDNPRIGNVEMIAESLKENGQFRPLIVQKSTGYVLGGNHTLKGAKKLGWKTVDVVFVDVDDDKAKKIVLADNRTSDIASYDPEALMKIINSLETPDVGTGYSTADVQSIITAVVERDVDLVTEVITDKPRISFGDEEDLSFDERMDRKAAALTESGVMDDDLRERYAGDDIYGTDLDDQQKLHVEIQAKVEGILSTFFTSSNEWGVPDLRLDMIPERLPEPLDTWAGRDTTPDDGKTHWILNWGSASSKEVPWNRVVLAFYSHDEKWDGWYDNTAYLLGKVISQGVRYAIAPDNSIILGFPKFMHLQAMYRGAWLARILQEFGIKVIPNIKMIDPESAKLAVLGIPKGTPTLAIGLQSMTEADMDQLGIHTLVRSVVQELQPQQFIVYGGPPARRCLEKAKIPAGIEGRYIENFSAKRNAALKPWHEERKKHDRAVKAERKRREEESG